MRNNLTKEKKDVDNSILNVQDVVDGMNELRYELVHNRELPQKEEFKVVVSFNDIEKQLRSRKPKRKKIDKRFNQLLSIFTTVQLSNTKECLEKIDYLKQGVENILAIRCA